MNTITILLMVLCFIVGFIIGDFFGIVRQEEKKMIREMQKVIDKQNDIIKRLGIKDA